MTMNKVYLLGLVLLLMGTNVQAQRSNIKEIRATRYEVTSSLDGTHRRVYDEVLAPYRKGVDSVVAPVLGESKVAMTVRRPECLLGNWAADALLEHSDYDGKGKADFALANIGGLRNNMPRGVVRQGDIMLISPFQNFLCVVQLKGSDVLELFRNIASVHGEALSHEVRMVATRDGQLKSVTISGQPIDENRVYHIATLDYLAEGNDKMVALKNRIGIRQSKIAVRDVLMTAVRRQKVIDAQIEGRVVIEQ